MGNEQPWVVMTPPSYKQTVSSYSNFIISKSGKLDAHPQSSMQQLKVRSLEQALRRPIRIAGIRNDDIKRILIVVQKLEPIPNVNLDLGVFIGNTHSLQVCLGDTDDSLVNVAEDGFLDTVVFDDLAEDTAVTATDDQDFLWVGMGVHGEVGDHLLVGELVALGALDDVVEDEDVAVGGGFKDKNLTKR